MKLLDMLEKSCARIMRIGMIFEEGKYSVFWSIGQVQVAENFL